MKRINQNLKSSANKKQKIFIKKMTSNYYLTTNQSSDSNNFEIMNKFIHINGLLLRLASEELQNNFNIVVEAVKNNGLSLAFASKKL